MARTHVRWGRDTGQVLAALPRHARLCWRLLAEERVPLATKLVPLAALLYVAMPLDLVPDWLPVVGQLDDLGILVGAVTLFVRLCPPTVVAELQRDLE